MNLVSTAMNAMSFQEIARIGEDAESETELDDITDELLGSDDFEDGYSYEEPNDDSGE